jgi:hypothetical protein
MLSKDVHFRECSLKYYSQAVKEVNQALAGLDSDHDCVGDPLLVTVQYLYINAVSLPLHPTYTYTAWLVTLLTRGWAAHRFGAPTRSTTPRNMLQAP